MLSRNLKAGDHMVVTGFDVDKEPLPRTQITVYATDHTVPVGLIDVPDGKTAMETAIDAAAPYGLSIQQSSEYSFEVCETPGV